MRGLPEAPTAPVTGEAVRPDLFPEERGALLQVASRYRGRAFHELADALGLCGPRPAGSGYMPASAGNPSFGSAASR